MCAYICSFHLTPLDCRRTNLVMSFDSALMQLQSNKPDNIFLQHRHAKSYVKTFLFFFFFISFMSVKSAVRCCGSIVFTMLGWFFLHFSFRKICFLAVCGLTNAFLLQLYGFIVTFPTSDGPCFLLFFSVLWFCLFPVLSVQ